ncbi:DUF4157 domain-containing protein [Kribbella sp. NPDC051952]|uniref:eCIS core domain-containing protein n=1 Tax=Kribbella sp. NPDC051952 TaxID=3154851 RepID=UPI00341349F7
MHAGRAVRADSEPESAARRRPARGSGAGAGPTKPGGLRVLGAGQAVPAALRTSAESAYGASLSGVTLHTGPAADAFVRSQGARATTEGNRVALASGYRPGTVEGDAVLAHELAHVVQQGAPAGLSSGTPSAAGHGGHEHEADHAAAAVLARTGRHDSAFRARGADPAAIAAAPAPRLSRGLGLRLQRCGDDPIYATSQTGPAPTTNAPVYAGAKGESFYDTLGMFDYRDGAFRATIDGDGDQSAELELAMRGSKPDSTVWQYPQQLDVTASRVGNTPGAAASATGAQTKSFDISGKSAERNIRPKLKQRTDGRSPTRIEAAGGLYVPFATMLIHPPSPDGAQADYRTVVERVKDYGEDKTRTEQTFSFSRDPNDIFPVFLPGKPQQAGSIWAIDVTMGRFGDLYRFTFYKPDPTANRVRVGISPMSGGAAVGTESLDVEASGTLGVAVVRARGPLLELDLNGDGRTDIRVYERMAPLADYDRSSFRQDPAQFRELRLTVTDSSGNREFGAGSRREVRKGEYDRETVNLTDEMDVVSAAATPEGLVEAAKVPDLVTDLARTQTTLKQLRQTAVEKAGFTAAVSQAYDRLVEAWLAMAGAAGAADRLDARKKAKEAATAFHTLWLAETASATVHKHHGGKEPYDTTSNVYTGYSDTDGFVTGSVVTQDIIDAVGASDLRRSGTLMANLGMRVANWVALKLRSKGLAAEADQVQGLVALTPMLEKLADKPQLKRVTAVFHSAPEYVKTGTPGNLPLRLYYWQKDSTWYLQDLTHPTNEDSIGIVEAPVAAGQTEPPKELFDKLNDEKRYPKGWIQYVLPGPAGRAGVVATAGDNGWTIEKVATWISLGLAGAALLAGVVLSGGAAAVAIPLLWTASAAAGAVSAVAEMVHESDQGRLTGGKIVMGMAQLIGSIAGGAVTGARAIGAARMVMATRAIAAGEAVLAAGEAAPTAAKLVPLSVGTLRVLTMTLVAGDSVQIVMATGQTIKSLEGIAKSSMSDGDKLKAYALAIGQFGVMAGLTYAGVRGNLHELNTALSKPGARIIQAGDEVLVPGRASAGDYAAELEKHLSPEAKATLAPDRVRIVSPEEAGSSIGLTRIEAAGDKVRVVVVDGIHPSSMREEAIHLEQLALGKRSAADIKKMSAGNPALEAELLRTRKATNDLVDINSRWATATPLERVRAHEARLELEIDGQRRILQEYHAKLQAGEPVDPVLVDNAFQNLDNLQIREAEMVGVRAHVSKGRGKPGEIDPQFELPPSLFAKKTVPTTQIPPSWYTLTFEEFLRAYQNRYPVSSLDKADLKLRYDMGKRLNPDTGRLVDINREQIDVPAKYKPGEEKIPLEGPNKVKLDPADEATTKSLLAKRDAARNARDTAEAKIPPDKPAAKAALYDMIQASRELGEHAASVYVRRTYPGPPAPVKIYPKPGAPSRSGDFDQVWKATGKDGKEVWLVNEAKGGSSDLSSRRVDEGGTGPRAEQGSTLYYDDILRNMRKSGGELRDAADLLEKAAKDGKTIRYLHASAPIESTAASAGGTLTSSLPEISVKEFDVSFGSAAAPTTGTVTP